MSDGTAGEVHDLVGVGIGPFNLSLAALADGVPGLSALFLEERPEFSWHPGLMLDDARLQVPFLADLVTLVDPTSRWSFLSYLRERDRLFRFYFAERFHLSRREYQDYCRWVAAGLGTCRFGAQVRSLRHDGEHWVLEHGAPEGGPRTVRARDVVLGIGSRPVVPAALRDLGGPRVLHSSEYLHRVDGLTGLADVTVVGSGQSGAEVVLDLLRRRAAGRVTWVTAAPAFAPMEYSKLGLEHFTPDYTRYFLGLPQAVRDAVLPGQWQLYKAISADTIADLHEQMYERSVGGADPGAALLPNLRVEHGRVAPDGGRIELSCRHVEQDRPWTHVTDAVVLATGYAAERPAFLDPVEHLIRRDEQGRYRVRPDHGVELAPGTAGRLFVQNAEEHTHGVGTPDLGLGAWRAATILNALTGGRAYRLPERTAFTTFGVPADGPR